MFGFSFVKSFRYFTVSTLYGKLCECYGVLPYRGCCEAIVRQTRTLGSRSNREAASANGERRGSHAINRFVQAAASRNDALNGLSGKWYGYKFVGITPTAADDCCDQACFAGG